MSALEHDLMTVNEAATLLRVAPSTIRRWIRSGDVPAYRLGPRRIALRRTDVVTLIAPVRAATLSNEQANELTPQAPEDAKRQAESLALLEKIRAESPEQREFPRLTDDEKQRGLEAMERMKALSDEILARRGGKPFPPSWQIIHEMREERDRQLMGE